MIPELLNSYELALSDVRSAVDDLSAELMVRQFHGSPNHPAGTLGHLAYSAEAIGGELDDGDRVDLAALRAAIAADRQRGLRLICVVGNAGTTNTGAVDDLEALDDLCADEKLWFHVDGAFGATAAVSERLRPLLRGMERPDGA